MILGQRRSPFLAILWLAIATVLVNALAPMGSPLSRSAGSAFNPFTSDVSLGPKRSAVVRKAAGHASLSTDGGSAGDGAVSAPAVLPRSPLFLVPPPARQARVPLPLRVLSGLPAAGRFRARAPPLA